MSKKEIPNEDTSTKKKVKIESKFDASKLRSLIDEAKDATEIMQTLNIKHKQTLKQYLLRLISYDRKLYDIVGLNVRNLSRPTINFKGEIKLSKKMLDNPYTTFMHGDQFDLTVDGDTIILKRIPLQ